MVSPRRILSLAITFCKSAGAGTACGCSGEYLGAGALQVLARVRFQCVLRTLVTTVRPPMTVHTLATMNTRE